eukprot:1155348-Pelagomonas_calceolata.AAC.5
MAAAAAEAATHARPHTCLFPSSPPPTAFSSLILAKGSVWERFTASDLYQAAILPATRNGPTTNCIDEHSATEKRMLPAAVSGPETNIYANIFLNCKVKPTTNALVIISCSFQTHMLLLLCKCIQFWLDK